MTRWLLICGDTQQDELAACHAETRTEAMQSLRPALRRAPRGSFVVSALSWGLGMAKPLPDSMCSACGVRPRDHGRNDTKCGPCRTAHRREAAGTGIIRRPHTEETRAKIRETQVQRHAARRSA